MFRTQEILRYKEEILRFQYKGRKFLFMLLIYVVLASISFVFLYPLIYMVVTSLKSVEDIVDPYVQWVPTGLSMRNFKLAYTGMFYLRGIINSSFIALVSSIAQVISCSFIGYGFARNKFPGRDVFFLLALFTFIVPPQTIIISLFILYKKLGWLNTYYPFIIPSFLGQGLRGALFIYIFRQFFRGFPQELEDAARIDGAGRFKIYSQIFLPLSKPAILVVLLFSFVWHWNDYYEPSIYLMDEAKLTMPIRLMNMILWLEREIGLGAMSTSYNIGVEMAGCFLVIVLPLILYAFTQKYFVSSIERTGLIE